MSARFQLENWNAPAWLDLAQDPFSSAWLSLGNFSSNSSLLEIWAEKNLKQAQRHHSKIDLNSYLILWLWIRVFINNSTIYCPQEVHFIDFCRLHCFLRRKSKTFTKIESSSHFKYDTETGFDPSEKKMGTSIRNEELEN